MSTTLRHSTIATFATHTRAEAAIKALQASGFDMKNLSVIGTNFQSEERAVGFYNAGDRVKFWGGYGAFWGGLWGLLFGGALFFIPPLGPVVVLGPLVGWIAGMVEGAALGGAAGILGGALVSAGVPEDSVVKYETELKAGNFLVLAHGTASEIEKARGLLAHDAMNVAAFLPPSA